jgi:hypothetical protein
MCCELNLMKRKLFLTLAIAFCFTMSATCEKQRRSSRYLIPDGYIGWVKVYFKVKDAPALPIEDGFYLFKFPASGVLTTSSEMEYGWGHDEYFYYSGETRHKLPATGWDGGGMIWAEHNGQTTSSRNEESSYQGFFIGTEAEYKDYGRYVADENPGPLDKNAIQQKKKKDGIQ